MNLTDEEKHDLRVKLIARAREKAATAETELGVYSPSLDQIRSDLQQAISYLNRIEELKL